MRTLSGYLKNPKVGEILADTEVELEALRSSPGGVPAGASSSFVTDGEGHYSIDLEPGFYRIWFTQPGKYRKNLGETSIPAGPETDLLTILAAEQSGASAMQGLLNEVFALREQTAGDAEAVAQDRAAIEGAVETGAQQAQAAAESASAAQTALGQLTNEVERAEEARTGAEEALAALTNELDLARQERQAAEAAALSAEASAVRTAALFTDANTLTLNQE